MKHSGNLFTRATRVKMVQNRQTLTPGSESRQNWEILTVSTVTVGVERVNRCCYDSFHSSQLDQNCQLTGKQPHFNIWPRLTLVLNDLKSRTSNLGSNTCKCETHYLLKLFPFSGHAVQSVLQWGKTLYHSTIKRRVRCARQKSNTNNRRISTNKEKENRIKMQKGTNSRFLLFVDDISMP